MKVLDTQFLNDYLDMALHGDSLGWHERNGGNFTYWMNSEEVELVKEELVETGEWLDIKTTVPHLANEYFLISGTGKYFHNMRKNTKETVGIIQLDETGSKYRICWGLENGGRPTSELPSHLMNMEVRALATNDVNRVIYHCHCPNVIALTFCLPIDPVVVTRELWEMMTECPIIFPEGVGVVDWMVPGGREIAVESAKIMETQNVVIWAHHGIFCSGIDFDLTFGLMHTIEKAAEIWLKVHACREEKRQTITVEGFKALAKAYDLDLDEKYLYQK